MSILGSYLTVEVDGAVVAETTDVSIKMKAKALDTTTKDSGLNASFMGGKIDLAIAGGFLYADTGANWDSLWNRFNIGGEVTVEYLLNSVSLFSGYGTLKVLRTGGGNSDSLVTGTYGIKYSTTPSQIKILTEDGLMIETEDGENIILE